MIREILVTSWKELQELLYEGSWRQDLRRFRSSIAFRGMPQHYSLENGLARLAGPRHELEGHILRNFRKYSRREVVPSDSIWNWLAVAQHHGAPTRLLDWTFSPYVALHFVTEGLESFEHDGVVWCVDYSKTNQFLPAPLTAILKEEGSDVFTAEMLLRAAGSLREFDALSSDPFVLFFEPPSLDDRIVNQFSLFSLMSSVGGAVDRWLLDHPEVGRKIIVPAALKWEIRDKLDQANITERVLYPGLDGLARWLTRYYRPTRRKPGESPE